jgi:hypothetical protein
MEAKAFAECVLSDQEQKTKFVEFDMKILDSI